MFRSFRRIFSFARRVPSFSTSLKLISIPIIYTYVKTYQKSIICTSQQDLDSVAQTSFKLNQYSNTLYELRKDYDDFIIITNVSGLSDNLKKIILRILQDIHNESLRNGRRIRVMYLETSDFATEKSLQEANNIKINNDVIFLIKNKYADKLQTFTIKELIENKEGLSLYFQPIITSNRNDVRTVIEKLDDNEAVLLYVGDDSEPAKLFDSEKRFKEAERAVFNEKKNIKFLFVDKEEELTAMGFTDTIPNHYHLILRQSPQSVTQSNLQMNNKKYHMINNIQLYDKNSKLDLDYYIDQVHTFSDNTKRYHVILKIDKNTIDPDKQEEIVTALRDVKKQNTFENLSYQIEFGAVDSSEAWSLSVTDLERLDQTNDKYLKGIKQLTDLSSIGKFTHRYKLESLPNKNNIQQFIKQVIEGKLHQNYYSEEPKVVNSIHKITGNTFNKHVIDNDKHHLVFQYSEHCNGCKQLAPIIVKFNTQNSNHSIQTHRLSEDNVIKGQIIYPYSPVLLFYKKGWKPNPIQIPIQAIAKESKNLKTYCEILADIESIDQEELDKHYFQASNLSWENLPYKLI